MNIVVLAGGLSAERDVSLTSGTLVCNALRRTGHRAILVDLFFGMEEVPRYLSSAFTSDGKLEPYKIPKEAPDIEKIRAMRGDSGYGEIGKNVLQLCRAADIVFMALHGEIGENGKLQAVFDVMDIKYTGTGYLGSTLAMNKGISKQLFKNNGIKTPNGRVYTQDEKNKIGKQAAFPCIVKPCSGGSSIGITRATNPAELSLAVEEAFRYESEILVEEYINGRELTCGVLGDTALPPAEIVPKGAFYDYTHKYQDGWITEICPAKIPEEITKKLKDVSLEVFRVLHLGVYARMDFIYDEKHGEVYCLEANTLPGLTPTSHMPQEAKIAGISYEGLCEEIINLSLDKIQKGIDMVPFKLAHIIAAAGGKYFGDAGLPDQNVTGVTIDSREVRPGFLFIPIKGEKYDGHDFIDAARCAGAICCLSERLLRDSYPYIFVPSALDAFQAIAQFYRSLFPIPVVGVSGSAGKTTSKELIACVLSGKFNVLKNEGNLNNQTGVPMTIMRLEPCHQAAVIEMGMNHSGEISRLSKIARPNICVITNIGEAHLEFLGSKKGILKAKSEMFEYMDPKGNIVINGDDPELYTLTSRYPDAITFGFKKRNRVRAKDIVDMGLEGVCFTASYEGNEIPVKVNSPGDHMIMNSLAALTVGALFGLDARQIREGIISYVPASGRMHVIETQNITILNDAYNANPTSMAASISIAAKAPGRSVCILGDMFELGESAAEFHTDIGRHAAREGINLIICVGDLARHIYAGARDYGAPARYFDSKDSLFQALPELLEKGDTVLVKASHGMRFDAIAQWLAENPLK